LGPQARSFPQ